MIYRKVYSVFFKNEKYLSKTLLTRRIPPTFRLCPADLACLARVCGATVIFIMILGSGSCDPYHFFVGSGRSILWSCCLLICSSVPVFPYPLYLLGCSHCTVLGPRWWLFRHWQRRSCPVYRYDTPEYPWIPACPSHLYPDVRTGYPFRSWSLHILERLPGENSSW